MSNTELERVMDFNEAMGIAGQAIHGDDGRGMIGQGRNHLKQRVARAIMNNAATAKTESVICDGNNSEMEHQYSYIAYWKDHAGERKSTSGKVEDFSTPLEGFFRAIEIQDKKRFGSLGAFSVYRVEITIDC